MELLEQKYTYFFGLVRKGRLIRLIQNNIVKLPYGYRSTLILTTTSVDPKKLFQR